MKYSSVSHETLIRRDNYEVIQLFEWGKGKETTQETKDKINKEIQNVLKPTYFKEIPLDDLFKVLDKYNIVPIQEDNTYWSGMLTGGVKRAIDTHRRYLMHL